MYTAISVVNMSCIRANVQVYSCKFGVEYKTFVIVSIFIKSVSMFIS